MNNALQARSYLENMQKTSFFSKFQFFLFICKETSLSLWKCFNPSLHMTRDSWLIKYCAVFFECLRTRKCWKVWMKDVKWGSQVLRSSNDSQVKGITRNIFNMEQILFHLKLAFIANGKLGRIHNLEYFHLAKSCK